MLEGLRFNAVLTESNGSGIHTQLALYKFKEGNDCIVYCPALDLSAFGDTYEDAKKSFEEIFSMHIEYCIQKNTLVKDLQNHGWVIKSKNQNERVLI
jgi:predicted RNase H-like HicB family nuclease